MPSLKNIETIDFTWDEFRQIIDISRELIKRGYFTGINLLRSDSPLPKSSIIVHFLHDSKTHLNQITSKLNSDYLIVPRRTYYLLSKEYFTKPIFREEYKNALFFDADFKEVSIDEAINASYTVTVSNNELDMLIPFDCADILQSFINNINEVSSKCLDKWLDPVIIVQTNSPVESLDDFVDRPFVTISREREIFYSVISDNKRKESLQKYLDQWYERNKWCTLSRRDILFYESQVNKEFADYLLRIQPPFRPFE